MFVTLGYHIVNRTIDDKIAISEETFEEHLRFMLREEYTTISVKQAIAIVNGEIQAPPRAVLLTFDDAYEDNARIVLPRLRDYGMRATEFVISAYVGRTNRWNPKAGYDVRHMTWEELDAWHESGCDIGGHSHHHLCMTRLTPQELKQTLRSNKQMLEDRLGFRIRAFAYPYGKFNEMVQEAVSQRYEIAFAVEDGTWDAQANRYAINRINITPKWGIRDFAKQLEQHFQGDRVVL